MGSHGLGMVGWVGLGVGVVGVGELGWWDGRVKGGWGGGCREEGVKGWGLEVLGIKGGCLGVRGEGARSGGLGME